MMTTSDAINGGTAPLGDEHARADAIETTAFTIPVEQAVELFKQAGFPYSADHISRLCRQGALRATKQPMKNGLARYIIERQSIDILIERKRREKDERNRPHVFEAVAATPTVRRHDADIDDAAAVSPRQHDGNDGVGMSPSFEAASYEWQHDRENAGELRGELRALKEQSRKDAARIEKLENENGGLRLSLGEYKGRAAELEKQVLQLMAPKPAEPAAPPPAPAMPTSDDSMPASPPTSWWRRLLGGS